MTKPIEEWLRQADYDLETAEFILQSGRRFYAVFMAHLAVKKSRKGLYQKSLQQEPPKTHNLKLLADRAGLVLATKRADFLVALSHAQVATRYTESLANVQREFTPEVAGGIVNKAREVIEWVKTQL